MVTCAEMVCYTGMLWRWGNVKVRQKLRLCRTKQRALRDGSARFLCVPSDHVAGTSGTLSRVDHVRSISGESHATRFAT